MDGGADICAESSYFHQQKTRFLLMKVDKPFIWVVIRSAVLYSA
jgi:hypothetical protein